MKYLPETALIICLAAPWTGNMPDVGQVVWMFAAVIVCCFMRGSEEAAAIHAMKQSKDQK